MVTTRKRACEETAWRGKGASPEQGAARTSGDSCMGRTTASTARLAKIKNVLGSEWGPVFGPGRLFPGVQAAIENSFKEAGGSRAPLPSECHANALVSEALLHSSDSDAGPKVVRTGH